MENEKNLAYKIMKPTKSTRARTLGNNRIFDGNKSAIGLCVERFHLGFAPSSSAAESSEKRQMRLFRRFAAHPRRETARLLLRTTSGANITRPESIAEILPFVDDGALGVVGQQFGQLPFQFLTDFGSVRRKKREFVGRLFAKDFVDSLFDLLLMLRVGEIGDEIAGLDATFEKRIPDGHEVGDEIVLAEKLKVAEPIAFGSGAEERRHQTTLELSRDGDVMLGGGRGRGGRERCDGSRNDFLVEVLEDGFSLDVRMEGDEGDDDEEYWSGGCESHD